MDTLDLTNDFVETFKDRAACVGIMARLVAGGDLPKGVNPDDLRVKQIIKWCNENLPA